MGVSIDSEFERFRLEEGDLLFARRSLIEEGAGKCVLVVQHDEPMVFESSIIRVRLNADLCDPSFYYYYFSSPVGRRVITAIITGVAQKGIRGSELENVVVHLPQKEEQKRIAGILSAYDDLIANNERRMALLEEAIHLLYREWFVHLRFPGYEDVAVNAGIPEGWQMGIVKDFGDVITGKTPSTKIPEYYDGEIPFVKTPDMHGKMFVDSTSTTLTLGGAESQAKKTIPRNTIMVSCIGTIGVVSISSEVCQTNQQINSLVLPSESYLPYCYFALKYLKSYMKAIGSSGATIGNVNKKKFENMPIMKPPQGILNQFYQFCAPILRQIGNIQSTSILLREARDALLPRLMSGKLAV